MLREREIRPAKLIIIPLFMLWGGAASIQPSFFHSPLNIGVCLVLLAAGLQPDSNRELVTVRINPENGNITSRGSIGSVILIIAVLGLRMAASTMLPGDNGLFTAITHSLFFIPLGTMAARNAVVFAIRNGIVK
ncbi:hypothetical protein AXI59_09570 [Bacillus nakamurai]|uniref:hypothetical protein n=1 Tax=Bacillus nakamurai TaxID=1793963 RepID=UPI0007783958|nr:hypothetical protein [Bacillus nakamurai]KXZ23330.1 hypothetical protein AXI59_09570 [Bacillus nakamurai]